MKKSIFVIIVLGIFLISQQVSFAEDLSVKYVNLSKIFNDYKKVGDSNKRLEEQKNQAKKVLDEMKELEKNFDQLNDKGKQERKTQIQNKQEEVRALSMEIRKEEDRILREILGDIEKAAEELRKKQKVSYIIDDRLIISGPAEMDITGELVNILNERYSKGK